MDWLYADICDVNESIISRRRMPSQMTMHTFHAISAAPLSTMAGDCLHRNCVHVVVSSTGSSDDVFVSRDEEDSCDHIRIHIYTYMC